MNPLVWEECLEVLKENFKKHEYSESLITSVQFSKTRNALKSKQKDLKKQGLGNRPKTADRISDADVDCLFEGRGARNIHTEQYFEFSLVF